MDVITVNGKEYDPYFILDVTRNDSDKHISKSFREKVKKYHPDKYTDKDKKIKYEKYFKILSESYQYIKNKRSNKNDLQKAYKEKSSKKELFEKKTRKDFDELNESRTLNVSGQGNKNLDPNDFGYGKNYKRIEKIEDYDNEDIVFCNQFNKKKFSINEFNKIFDYNKRNENDDIADKALIHKTTDGFAGYNSGDLGSSALVSSFNGLLITGDDLGERGIGYWGNNFSDYNHSYKKLAKNPDKQIKVPSNFKKQDTYIDENLDQKYLKYKNNYSKNNTNINTSNTSFKNEEGILYKNTYDELLEKEEYDKKMVLKYIKQYDDETIKMALSGELDQAPTYISTLKKYITEK